MPTGRFGNTQSLTIAIPQIRGAAFGVGIHRFARIWSDGMDFSAGRTSPGEQGNDRNIIYGECAILLRNHGNRRFASPRSGKFVWLTSS
jgi:hypothetical protein